MCVWYMLYAYENYMISDIYTSPFFELNINLVYAIGQGGYDSQPQISGGLSA